MAYTWKDALLVSAVLLLLIGLWYASSSSNESFQNPTEPTFTMYYADWCGHCKTAKPVWESLKRTYETDKINDCRIIFTEVNCTKETKEIEELMDKFNIEGYPTFKLVKDDKIYEFDAKPTEDSLISFMTRFV
jgi:thiol-disulfide isomerase/thioredoxin